eukprot:270738-Ditylum_brightwellii.AAC.2
MLEKDCLRETIQFVATKKPPISFNADDTVDCKMGNCCTYKLCTQPEEESAPMYLFTVEVFELGSPKEWLVFESQAKQIIEGQNINNIDTAYILVYDLLKVNVLMAFNNEQANIEEQTLDNLDRCLDVVMLHISPNKAY